MLYKMKGENGGGKKHFKGLKCSSSPFQLYYQCNTEYTVLRFELTDHASKIVPGVPFRLVVHLHQQAIVIWPRLLTESARREKYHHQHTKKKQKRLHNNRVTDPK